MTGAAISTNYSNVPAIRAVMKAHLGKQFTITLEFLLRHVWRLVNVFLTVWAFHNGEHEVLHEL